MRFQPWQWPRIRADVRRWQALSPVEKGVTAEAALALLLARVIVTGPLRSHSTGLVRRILNGSGIYGATSHGASLDTVGRIQRAIARASHRLEGCTCLVQALAAWLMFRRRGVESRLHLGVDNSDGRFAAHAWLEVNGTVVVGGANSPSKFVTLRRVSADKVGMSV